MSKPDAVTDPLDAWLEDLYERAAIFQFEAGMTKEQAEAWADLHVTKTRGPRPQGSSACLPDPVPNETKPKYVRPSTRSRR